MNIIIAANNKIIISIAGETLIKVSKDEFIKKAIIT
jgi:hypothetical protein